MTDFLEIIESSDNVIEAMGLIHRKIVLRSHLINPNFFGDVIHYYPGLLNDSYKRNGKYAHQQLVDIAIAGIKDGIFKEDMDIEFYTELPLVDSKYSFIQAGKRVIITKQLIFGDNSSGLFVQTILQPDKPTPDQAKGLAKNFDAVVTESDEHLYNLKGDNSNGIIGYCPDKHLAYLLFSTIEAPLNAVCKREETKQNKL